MTWPDVDNLPTSGRSVHQRRSLGASAERCHEPIEVVRGVEGDPDLALFLSREPDRDIGREVAAQVILGSAHFGRSLIDGRGRGPGWPFDGGP